MSRLVKIADRKDLLRDKATGAILYCNDDEYKKHKHEKKKEKSKEERLNNIEKTLAEVLKLLKNLNEPHSSK